MGATFFTIFVKCVKGEHAACAVKYAERGHVATCTCACHATLPDLTPSPLDVLVSA